VFNGWRLLDGLKDTEFVEKCIDVLNPFPLDFEFRVFGQCHKRIQCGLLVLVFEVLPKIGHHFWCPLHCQAHLKTLSQALDELLIK
jgi:hypothetical protein